MPKQLRCTRSVLFIGMPNEIYVLHNIPLDGSPVEPNCVSSVRTSKGLLTAVTVVLQD